MPDRGSTVAFAIGSVLVIAIALVVSWQNTDFNVEAKINLFVAVGTLALAFTTWWSVSETRAIIAAEDRRHQQSYAPLLHLDIFERNNDTNIFRAFLNNYGQGMAQNINVQFLDGVYIDSNSNATTPDAPIPDESKKHVIGALATSKGAQVLIPPKTSYTKVSLQHVVIEYQDMFGNSYSTEYNDFTNFNYNRIWKPPPALKPPSAG
jgi:hypothetical protein